MIRDIYCLAVTALFNNSACFVILFRLTLHETQSAKRLGVRGDVLYES